MRKFSTHSKVRFLLFIAVLFLSGEGAYSQCGISAFNQGITLTPTATWTNVSVGSGTYQNFNAAPNRIYSFEYVNAAVLPYVWDMTVSTSSGVLPYNNSLTPIKDPWTGGTCP